MLKVILLAAATITFASPSFGAARTKAPAKKVTAKVKQSRTKANKPTPYQKGFIKNRVARIEAYAKQGNLSSLQRYAWTTAEAQQRIKPSKAVLVRTIKTERWGKEGIFLTANGSLVKARYDGNYKNDRGHVSYQDALTSKDMSKLGLSQKELQSQVGRLLNQIATGYRPPIVEVKASDF